MPTQPKDRIKFDSLWYKERGQKMVNMKNSGQSDEQIADHYRMSVAWVTKIIRDFITKFGNNK